MSQKAMIIFFVLLVPSCGLTSLCMRDLFDRLGISAKNF